MTRLSYLDTSLLDDDGLFAAVYRTLSSYRQEKADALRFRKDKNLCLGAGLLLDAALRERGLRERDVQYALGENGKPYLPEIPGLHFNLSHSGTVVLGVFSGREVGCDVERLGHADDRLARRCFTEEEYRRYAAIVDDTERTRYFYRLWTRKESLMKATGRGLLLPPETICCTEERITAAGVDGKYCCYAYSQIDGYAAAVCIAGTEPKPALICRNDLPEQMGK